MLEPALRMNSRMRKVLSIFKPREGLAPCDVNMEHGDFFVKPGSINIFNECQYCSNAEKQKGASQRLFITMPSQNKPCHNLLNRAGPEKAIPYQNRLRAAESIRRCSVLPSAAIYPAALRPARPSQNMPHQNVFRPAKTTLVESSRGA